MDVKELPVVCVETEGVPIDDSQWVGGVRIGNIIRTWNHQLHYIFLSKGVIEQTLLAVYPSVRHCDEHEGVIGFERKTNSISPPITFSVDTPLFCILAELLSYMHMFRRHGVSNQAKDVWLTMSTTYHVYIRHYLENDPTWHDKVEPLHLMKKAK